jgi:hypothetical protein
VQVDGDKIRARIRFAPAGISDKADEIRGLVKSRIVSTVSVGMDPIEMEPIDPAKPRGGQRMTQWELLEISFCSVPVDTGAVVTARAVPENDKETSRMTDKDRAAVLRAARTRMLVCAPDKPQFRRGLYDVAQLAYALQGIGFIQDCAAWEAECEGDGSVVPAMLGEAMRQVGAALIAMTSEEVGELLADLGEDGDDDVDLPDDERAFVAAGKTPIARAWRRGIAAARLGRALSALHEKQLERARSNHARAQTHHRAIGEQHGAIGGNIDNASSAHSKAETAHGKLGGAVQAAHEAAPSEHTERALKHHRALGGHLEGIAEAHRAMGDNHADLGDSHASLGRSLDAAAANVRAVLDGAVPGSEDGNSHEVQKSDGVKEEDGARALASYRKRQADLLALVTH